MGVLATFWVLPAYLYRRRTGDDPSAFIVVPLYFVALIVWIVCASYAGVIGG